MKTLVVSLLLIVIAIATAFFIHKDPGQVDVTWLGVHYGPMTLGLVLAGIGVAFVVFYLLLRAFMGLLNAPKSLKKRGERKRQQKAHEAMGQGLIEYSEGNFESAESILTKNLSSNSTCDTATFITAAKAANERGKHTLSAKYLQKAADCSPESEVAVGITEASMLMQRHSYKDALKKLTSVRKAAPKNKRAIWLLINGYKETHNWEKMTELLKTARKLQAAPKDQLLNMEKIAAGSSLNDAAKGNIQAIYEDLPVHIQESSEIVKIYAQRLNENEQGTEAIALITKSLDKNWNDDLVELFGRIESSDLSAQLDQAEKWKAKNGESVALLLTISNLAYRKSLWTKAKESVVKSISMKPSKPAFFTLGKILEAIDDPAGAMEAYKHGYAVNSEEGYEVSPTITTQLSGLANPAKIESEKEVAPA